MSDSAGDKTHEATPHKREEAQKEGRFAKSRDIGAVASTAAVLGMLLGSRSAISQALQLLFVRSHGDLTAIARGDLTGVRQAVIGFVAVSSVPAAIAAATVGAGAGLAQSGARLNLDALSLRPERLNPFPNLQQLFSPAKGSLEVLMGLLRVTVVGYVVYRSLFIELPGMLTYCQLAPAASSQQLVSSIVHVVTNALYALGAIAAVDYAKSRFMLARDMRMSRQEIVDESRSRDGDPKVKGRMRARARAIARKRSLANVKKATVVVSNPTHISVALRYSPSDAAPVVVAKGHDEVALQIRSEARRYGIPILENRALARALDAEVQIGHAVPSAHFAAVARILAFVFRLRGHGTRRAR
ncbi:MAG: flagellar biosynthesis protein FlhB [Polyangiaceae bacterium]